MIRKIINELTDIVKRVKVDYTVIIETDNGKIYYDETIKLRRSFIKRLRGMSYDQIEFILVEYIKNEKSYKNISLFLNSFNNEEIREILNIKGEE